jgi:putative tryptophan/tyrosine transport system substrate-binding protein
MRRRDVILCLGGVVAAWPLGVRAQQGDRLKRIGVLMAHPADDPDYQSYLSAFRQEIAERGWMEGRNVKIDARWGALDDPEMRERSAKELLALKPDLLLTQNTPPTASILHLTRTVPVVFVVVADPVGSGFVKSLALPGANATGFTIMEPSMGGKWLELLKEIAPQVRRVAFYLIRQRHLMSTFISTHLKPPPHPWVWRDFPRLFTRSPSLKPYSRHRLVLRIAAWF